MLANEPCRHAPGATIDALVAVWQWMVAPPPNGRITTMATMSLRLDDDQARALSAVAMADETSVSEVIREAIADRIEKVRNDKDFQTRLERAVERNREALELLAK
jgi:hypothetical protein